MSLLSTMRATWRVGLIPGTCAHCRGEVFESLAMLDDAYNVWAGRCPHCDAVNLLAMTSLRGYSSARMDLVLPTDEEARENKLPEGIPTRGPGGPTRAVGTLSGALMQELFEGDK